KFASWAPAQAPAAAARIVERRRCQDAVATIRDFQAAHTGVWAIDVETLSSSVLLQSSAKVAVVVISADGAAVDPFFLRLIRPETLVLAVSKPAPRVVQ